jgi:cytosine/adenosine deaminase-related metal-dependent hydrolase
VSAGSGQLAERFGGLFHVVLLRSTDINLAGGLLDPVATVVTGADPGNIDTVLVGGTPVKRDERLVSTSLPTALGALAESATYLDSAA